MTWFREVELLGPRRIAVGGREAAGVGWRTRAGCTRGGEGLHQTLRTTQLPRQEPLDLVS